MNRNKYPLTTQTTHLFIVIRKNKKISETLITKYCEEFFDEWSWIEHEKDIEPITGIEEGCHYHIVGNSKKKKTPLSTHLNDLVKFFRFDNSNGVQVDKYDNYVKAIQYLIHKNNPEKTQHEFKDIKTNIAKEDLKNIIASDSGDVISFDMVYSICLHSKSIIEVIRDIGFKSYAKYRNTIRDIFDEIKKG